MTNYTELKRLAEAAKRWGSCNQAWIDTAEDEGAAVVGHISEDGEIYPVVVVDCEQYYAGGDSIKLADFYAAANTNVVLSMIAEIDRLKGHIKHIGNDALRTQNQALREALQELVGINEKHNAACAEVIGHPIGWKDTYLDAARAALAEGGV
jgi:hypothetical protein